MNTAAAITLNVNGKDYNLTIDGKTPLLWAIREHIGLTGTKYGCGVSSCGACTIHANGKPLRSCSLPAEEAQGLKLTTIEGLSELGDHPVQKAWIKAQAPQCGYCQSGQIMQATALLNEQPNPSRQEIKTHMNGILCRCGSYSRILKAIESVTSENK